MRRGLVRASANMPAMEAFVQSIDNSWMRELRCDPDAEANAPNKTPRQATICEPYHFVYVVNSNVACSVTLELDLLSRVL